MIFSRAAVRMAPVYRTLYGDMWSFFPDLSKDRTDTVWTREGLGAHNDTAYFAVPAGIQVLVTDKEEFSNELG